MGGNQTGAWRARVVEAADAGDAEAQRALSLSLSSHFLLHPCTARASFHVVPIRLLRA